MQKQLKLGLLDLFMSLLWTKTGNKLPSFTSVLYFRYKTWCLFNLVSVVSIHVKYALFVCWYCFPTSKQNLVSFWRFSFIYFKANASKTQVVTTLTINYGKNPHSSSSPHSHILWNKHCNGEEFGCHLQLQHIYYWLKNEVAYIISHP